MKIVVLHFIRPSNVTYIIYILECENGTFYTGYTTDLDRRFKEHLSGSPKCKYTRSFPPKRIAASWQFECSVSDILKLERNIKKLSKKQKEALIASPEQIDTVLP